MKNCKSIKVAPEFAKMLKIKAADEDTSIIKLTKQWSDNLSRDFGTEKRGKKKNEFFPI